VHTRNANALRILEILYLTPESIYYSDQLKSLDQRHTDALTMYKSSPM